MNNQWYLGVKNKIWVVPALYTLAGFILAAVSIQLDIHFFNEWHNTILKHFLVDVSLAQIVLSTIAGSLLTMTTITFSIIMVVLTTYSSQFSPRTLQTFITDSVTKRVMGVFIGGFVYSIGTLLFMKNDLVENKTFSPSIGTLVAVVCLAFFAYFIHYVATSIQVNKLIEKIAADLSETIASGLNKIEETDRLSLCTSTPQKGEHYTDCLNLTADIFGYIQLIQGDELADWARENNSFIEVTKPVGSYISRSSVIMKIYYNGQKPPRYLKQKISVGNNRTTMQDVGFGLQKLAEIGLRAISPGVNDPNTAIECIQHMGSSLKEAAKLDGCYLNYKNDENQTIVSIPQRPFEELLRLSFYQIIHHGKDDISVVLAIYDSLIEIAEENTYSIRKKVKDFSEYVMEKADVDSFPELDKALLDKKKQRVDKLLKPVND
ncbi:DUF2254 domain-containing protein [Bacillus sp. ISL-39]|uniref:DUF2254 domain-containing protein n=1 Tax=Bacillus sp. ISL-39 TaxID=2819124 RepID=UPI001BEA1B75|nr:DUF2254 domain-containing protein [Bacillus sp. ISL-39]MBT2636757.1 DUF2254 domain-containing protein [Bacillus sp. ISL-39]